MGTLLRAELEDHIQRQTPHLADGEVAALAEIVALLVDAYEPQRIYLFGSKACGDHGPDSDFDLLVIVPDDAEGERKDSKLAYRCLSGIGTAADVLVMTHGWFGLRAHLRASLPGTVLR